MPEQQEKFQGNFGQGSISPSQRAFDNILSMIVNIPKGYGDIPWQKELIVDLNQLNPSQIQTLRDSIGRDR